jgi:hypothetical protein
MEELSAERSVAAVASAWYLRLEEGAASKPRKAHSVSDHALSS